MNYCRAGIFLLSLLTIHSCGGGGGGDSSPSGAADTVSSSAFVNANGALAGDIWFEGDFDETFRFNLETGTTSKISNFKVSPNPDGTMYVKFEPDVSTISSLGSGCGAELNFNELSVVDTRTGNDISNFRTLDQILTPIRLSPDGSRIMAQAKGSGCEASFNDPYLVSIYSADGNLLMRFNESIVAFDWMTDGRAAVVQSLGGRSYQLLFESEPGSLQFPIGISWVYPDNFQFLRTEGLRSNPDGTQFLIEVVLDESSVVTLNYRYSDIILLDVPNETLHSVFKGNESDTSLRATEPLFSPDGSWVLSTQNYFTGGAIITDNTGTPNPVFQTDIAAITLPSSGVLYAVPSQVVDQLLPPNELTGGIQPVLQATDFDTLQPVRLNPLGGQAWTPTVR